MEERKFMITESKRDEIIRLLNNRSLIAAKNALNQLEEIKEKKE